MTAVPPEPDTNTDTNTNTNTQNAAGARGGIVGFLAVATLALMTICLIMFFSVIWIGALALLLVSSTVLFGLVAWLALRSSDRWRETMMGLVAAMGLSGWFGVESLRGRVATTAERESDAPIEAFQDPLTTLPNRALFLNRLEQAIARGVRLERPVAVLFIDLDNFKYINDTFGHAAGDHLLISLAAVLQATLRASDTAARLGGDEFVVLLEDMNDPGEATLVAERIMQSLQVPFVFGEREIYVTASVGIAVSSSPLIRPDELLHNADVAMYRAKQSGKSRFEIFDATMNREVQERRRLERDLARAVERGEFRIFYQPKVRLETGTIVGVEALLRWQHPERGLLYPKNFLSIAEETNLIVDIGRWVLREACMQAREWYHTDLKPTISVNLSSREFYSADLPQQVARNLRDAGLPPSALGIEVSERVVMEKPDRALAILQQLKAIGVRTVIDDFGEAYSSLRHLKRFPIDFLKIDRSYLAGLGQNPEDTVILSTLITVAHSLGLKVLAEGVETSSQAAWLRQLRCDLAQGFYFAKPTVSRMASFLFDGDIEAVLA